MAASFGVVVVGQNTTCHGPFFLQNFFLTLPRFFYVGQTLFVRPALVSCSQAVAIDEQVMTKNKIQFQKGLSLSG